jgi:predicted DNA-binding transcriptional regulator YafY
MRAIAAATEAQADRTPRTASGVLAALALACRAGEAVSFRHRPTVSGHGRRRAAQPHRLVNLRQRWYLVACERGADSWRSYATDRITDVRPLGTRLATPEPPDDALAFVVRTLSLGPWRHRVRVRLHTSEDLARELIDPSVGDVRDDGDSCILTMATDDLDWAARWLIYRNIDFDVLDPQELEHRLHSFGRWLADRYGVRHG